MLASDLTGRVIEILDGGLIGRCSITEYSEPDCLTGFVEDDELEEEESDDFSVFDPWDQSFFITKFLLEKK